MHEDSRIRVVQFLTATTRAGAEEVALELVRRLNPDRFRSFLVCPQTLLDAYGNDWRVGDNEAMPLTLVSPRQWKEARQFVSFLRGRRIEVVHAHMIRAAATAIPLARLARVPVVLHTCHGREAWRSGWLKESYWVDRILSALADRTIAVSESTGDYLLREKKLNPRKVTVIRNGRCVNGLDRSPARRQALRREFGIRPNDPVVCIVGRLEEQKGHRYLLDALPQVLSTQGTLKVLLVGDGVLRTQLEMQSRERGLTGAVIFAGYRKDSLALMDMSDLVVLPSLYEGMPLVPIEAALLGKPVLATAVDGTREVVEDGQTGRLVPPRDVPTLARAIRELLDRPEELQRFGRNAEARAREIFTLERQTRDTENLYAELLRQKQRGRIRGAIGR